MSTETYKPKIWQPTVVETPTDIDSLPKPQPFFVTGVVTSATGSVYYESGLTKIVCAAFGPKQSSRAQYSESGVLSCDFSYAPFALDYRRRRGKNDPEETNISVILKETLSATVQLHTFPKHELQIFVVVLERGSNEVAAAINAATLALVDSGVEMFDISIASTCAYMKDTKSIIQNPTIDQLESDHCRGTVTLAHMPSLKQITMLSQSGRSPVSRINDMVRTNISSCDSLAETFRSQIANNVVSNFVLSESYSEAISNAVHAISENGFSSSSATGPNGV